MAAVFGEIYNIPGFSEPFSCWTHLIGAAIGIAMTPPMLKAAHKLQRPSLAIYAISAIVLLCMSGVFHLLEPGRSPRAVFLRLDHAAIWVLIAGSITPMLMMGYRKWKRWGGIAFLWTATLTGLVLKTIFFEEFPEWLSLSLYLALGWIGALSAWGLTRRLGLPTVRWFVLGGLVYSGGAILDFARLPTIIPHVIGPHEVFHLCVLGGIACHWRYLTVLSGLTRSAHVEQALLRQRRIFAGVDLREPESREFNPTMTA